MIEPFHLEKHPIPRLIIESWERLDTTLSVGFTTRNGGVSNGDYKTLNLALHVGDFSEDVIANRRILSNALGFSFDAWTSGEQVHSNHIEIIRKDRRGKGRFLREDAIQNTDGIVTDEEDILLTSFYADCVPLLFFDSVKKVIGLAHAGWKGTQLKIGEEMVKTMVHSFGSQPEDIRVAVGPSIGQCCYEVDNRVVQPIQSTFKIITEEMIFDKKNGHYDINLKKINQKILIHAGILPNHIEISSYCTSCDNDLFFSHRKEKGKTGRMAAWIGFRKDEL